MQPLPKIPMPGTRIKPVTGCGLGAEDEVRVRHDLNSLTEPGDPILKVLNAIHVCSDSHRLVLRLFP